MATRARLLFSMVDEFHTIERRFRKRLLCLARGILKSYASACAEDVVQEVLCKFFRRQGRADLPAVRDVDQFLTRATRNAAIDALRKAQNTLEVVEEMGEATLMPEIAEDSPLLSALRELPRELRDPVLLCDVLELAQVDAAILLGTSVSKIKSLKRTAHVALRAQLSLA